MQKIDLVSQAFARDAFAIIVPFRVLGWACGLSKDQVVSHHD
jgi:hypothetical protein